VKFIFGPLEIKKKVSDVFNDITHASNLPPPPILVDTISRDETRVKTYF
jgi:hypothetical protein